MKTNKILTALALPLMFAACSEDSLVEMNQNPANEIENRPTVGQVEFVDAQPLTRYAVDESANLSWSVGDKFGMILMDEAAATAGGANISNRFYNLVNKAYTNYPFTRNASNKWVSEAELVEGNYFYYYPYTQAQTGDRNVSRATGLTWNIPATQEIKAGENAYKPVQDNQLYLGYQALSADASNLELVNKMAPVFPTITFNLTNTDATDVVINRIVLEKSADDGFGSIADAFNTKFTLDVVNGASKAIDYKPILNTANGNYDKDIDVTEGSAINKAFGSFNQALAEDFNNYEKAPFANMETSYLASVANSTASTFVLELPDYTLKANEACKATLVVPNDIISDQLQARIYTDKGIVLLPLTVGAYTVETIKSEDTTNGLVKYTSKTLKEDEVADASVALATLNAKKEWVLYGTKDNAATEFASLLPNLNATVSIKFNSKAIAVPGKMDIYSTEDLNAFLSYAGKANVTKDTPMEATLKANGIKLSKDAYAILKGNSKIQLTVKADQARSLTIASDVEGTDALYKLIWGDNVTTAVIEGGAQILKADFSKNIQNKGTLTINQNDNGKTGDAYVAQPTVVSGTIFNIGTLNVNGTLTADVVNGALKENPGYDDVITSASVVITKSITGKLTNAAKAKVGENVTIDEVENQKNTKSKNADKVAELETTGTDVTFTALDNGGKLTVGTKYTLLVGNSESAGTIENNGNFKPFGAFENSGKMTNNYGIVCQTTGTFTNSGTLTVGADATYTYITSNAEMVVIEERNANLTIADAKQQGDISYTAADADFAGDKFASAADDKFNMLTIKKNGADLTSLNANAWGAAVGTNVDKIVLEVSDDCDFTFAANETLAALTVGNGNNLINFYAVGMSVGDLEIKSNTTMHIPNGYDVTCSDAAITNAGTLLVGGTFTATNMTKPSGDIVKRYEEAGGNIVWK